MNRSFTITEEKQVMINELKEKVQNVRNISEHFRKRRPIVIEFSGAPKSGKTTSINSLMQFLKRNDFNVKVIQESASICPVADKHSPMFNLWTLCDSLKSLIGIMESDTSDLDVVIVDRGIFDAMCWFKWLSNSNKIENDMLNTIQSFITMERLIRYIDIVFVFLADAEISIKREYADLLTDVRGSIMNEDTLESYSKAVRENCEENRNIFRKVIQIDTSKKGQDDVGREVTQATLDSIKELFEEAVGCFEPPEKFKEVIKDKGFINSQELEYGMIKIEYRLRSETESDVLYIQPIPIAVLYDGRRVLFVKKTEEAAPKGSPEHDKFLAYVGGHIRKEDQNVNNKNDFLKICKSALHREIGEELGISVSLDCLEPYFIYSCDNVKSCRHLAVCFFVQIKEKTVKFRMRSNELLTNRGLGKSGRFYDIDEISENDLDMWSINILKNYFQRKIVISNQISLDFS